MNLDQLPCVHCGQLGFHSCLHQKLLWDIKEKREAQEAITEDMKRNFWERAVLQAFADGVWILAQSETEPEDDTGDVGLDSERVALTIALLGRMADQLTAEWSERFATEQRPAEVG